VSGTVRRIPALRSGYAADHRGRMVCRCIDIVSKIRNAYRVGRVCLTGLSTCSGSREGAVGSWLIVIGRAWTIMIIHSIQSIIITHLLATICAAHWRVRLNIRSTKKPVSPHALCGNPALPDPQIDRLPTDSMQSRRLRRVDPDCVLRHFHEPQYREQTATCQQENIFLLGQFSC